MSILQDIEDAVRRLPPEELESLERWFYTQVFPKYRPDSDPSGDLQVREPAAAYGAGAGQYLSIDDYRKFEAASPLRHEYVAGEIFAMTGASLSHNRVAGRLFSAFSNHLRGGRCEAFMADLRLHIQTDRHEFCYYPDLMVACGLGGGDVHEIESPTLVIEVLSPSTEKSDRREKALNYRQIPSLEEFVLVAQHRPEMTIYRRSDHWKPQWLGGEEAVVEFRSIGLSVPLGQIFEGML